MPDSLSNLSFWPLCLDARFVKQLFKCTSFTDPRGVLVISIDFVSMINVGAKKAAATRQLKASKARTANMQSKQARALEQQRVRELRLQQLAASADEEKFEIEDGYVDFFRGKVCCRPLPVSTLHLFQVSLRLSIYHKLICYESLGLQSYVRSLLLRKKCNCRAGSWLCCQKQEMHAGSS